MSTTTEAVIAYTACSQCGAPKGQPCVTTAPSHRATTRRYKTGRPTYPHRERRQAFLAGAHLRT